MKVLGFDTDQYLKAQSEQIYDRVNQFDKLYLEFGGKLIGDKHAKRVLPGFREDAKMELLYTMKDRLEVVICVYAKDIEQDRVRGDYGITYDQEVLRLIDEYRERQVQVNSVVITRYTGEKNADILAEKLQNHGIKVYKHSPIEGYPTDIDNLFGPEGFEKNSFVETTQPIVVVTGPGAGSGKLATCLSQLYHENKGGVQAGYAKFETFPVWQLPLKHPVNMAYEAATVDLKDTNVIDNYHYEAYGQVAVNYNRDVKMFPVVKRILENILGETVYQSPTDMGVNCLAQGIIDEDVVKEAANQEIIRRYFEVENAFLEGHADDEMRSRMHLIMEESDLDPEDRAPVVPARSYADDLQKIKETDEVQPVISIQLHDGKIISGRTSSVMDASAASVINALKYLANIADQIDLLAPMILGTIQKLKEDELDAKVPTLTCNEVLIALAISAVTNPTAKLAYDQLPALTGTQAHSNVILSQENQQTLRKLGIDVTNDPVFATDNLFYN